MNQCASALESRLSVAAFLTRELTEGWKPRPNDSEDSRVIRRIAAVALEGSKCETYYWSQQIADAVWQSSQHLPDDTTVSLEGIPSDGWMWFEQPFSPGLMSQFNELRGILWTTMSDGMILLTSFGGPRGNVLTLDMASVMFETGRPMGELGTNDPTIDDNSDGPWAGHLPKMARFWMAAILWMQQTIVVADKQTAGRATRRRLERQGKVAPLINVVRLRRALRQNDSMPREHQEWSCQWIVRGHWRQQFYPSKNERRPTWILPYVKGPEGKPLKVPTHTVYSVSR